MPMVGQPFTLKNLCNGNCRFLHLETSEEGRQVRYFGTDYDQPKSLLHRDRSEAG